MSCLAIFATGIVYEGVKMLRLRLNSQRTQSGTRSTTSPHQVKPAISQQLLEFILYSLQLSLAYALMLVVMTYNVWLSLAVVLGAAIGNSVFSRFAISRRGEYGEVSVTADTCH